MKDEEQSDETDEPGKPGQTAQMAPRFSLVNSVQFG